MAVSRVRAVVSVVVLGCAMTAVAQPGRVYTTADYVQAEKFMNNLLEDLVMDKADHPAWMVDTASGTATGRDREARYAVRSGEGNEGASVRAAETYGCGKRAAHRSGATAKP